VGFACTIATNQICRTQGIACIPSLVDGCPSGFVCPSEGICDDPTGGFGGGDPFGFGG
jgi:hypothetical protein